MTHEDLWALLGAQFEADGVVDMHADEFVPRRALVPPASIVHRIPLIARFCQDLRTASGGRLHVTNGYRDPAYNNRVGGAANSQHVQATAADLVSNVWTPDQVAAWAHDHRWSKLLGVGRYNTFTHVDVRGFFPWTKGAQVAPAPARWDLRSQ